MCAATASCPGPLQTPHSFAGISRFLLGGVIDEDARQLRDSLGALSVRIDEAVRVRRSSTDTADIMRRVLALSHCAREHHVFLTGRAPVWHALYEFGAYLRALRELRSAIADWQQMLERRSAREGASFDQFELLAWRTLGEALLLIDIYEQHSEPAGAPATGQTGPPAARRASVLEWARAWLRGLLRARR